MIWYKLTLLKDLPDVPAGYSYSASENLLDPYDPDATPAEREARTFMVNHRTNPEWVSMSVDYTQAVQGARCSTCGKPLFRYWGKETYYEAQVGLECACCHKKIPTHVVQKRVDWRD